jgi:hemerythrin-like domain-containing protein
MSGTDFKLDMTMMFTLHDALRRELAHLARITERTDDDPRHILRSAAGWEMFKKYLHVHHTAEDAMVWPVMQSALAGRPDDLALLDAMEAEHAAIDPLLESIDAALADREAGPQQLGVLIDQLRTGVSGHLAHEERDALPLIDVTLTEQQWQRFGAEHGNRIGDDARRYLPWILDNADPQRAALVLGRMPAPAQAAYRDEWLPEFSQLRRWDG